MAIGNIVGHRRVRALEVGSVILIVIINPSLDTVERVERDRGEVIGIIKPDSPVVIAEYLTVGQRKIIAIRTVRGINPITRAGDG